MDLISREEVIQGLRNYADIKCFNGEVELANGILKAKCYIEKRVQSIKAKPVVHGEWIHLGGDEWCCSECEHVITTEGSWEKPKVKFCEECGADMRKKVE